VASVVFEVPAAVQSGEAGCVGADVASLLLVLV